MYLNSLASSILLVAASLARLIEEPLEVKASHHCKWLSCCANSANFPAGCHQLLSWPGNLATHWLPHSPDQHFSRAETQPAMNAHSALRLL